MQNSARVLLSWSGGMNLGLVTRGWHGARGISPTFRHSTCTAPALQWRMLKVETRLDLAQTPVVQPVISFRQIAAVRLLQQSSQELAHTIARERDDNPALDVEEREWCMRCGSGLDRPELPCPNCGSAAGASDRDGASQPVMEMEPIEGGSAPGGDDEYFDPLLRVSGAEGRAEGLLHLLLLACPADDADIAEFVIGSLDSHGFLPESIITDGAEVLQLASARVERVVTALQRLEPPGIGARSAGECLLIQLRRLALEGESHPLAERLVMEYLRPLALRRFREVAHALDETPRAIELEWEFIRSHLVPYPAHGYDPDMSNLAGVATAVRPDVIIRRKEEDFEAEVVEARRYDLRINQEYRQSGREAAASLFTERERAHLRLYRDQAQTFISALRQRWDTMQRVSDALIELQREFLEWGPKRIKPLTRADVARRIGLHESTVSRATDGKFVLLPNGRTVPFDDFFDSSLPIKKLLGELIASESSRRPYSDEQLARLLARRGTVVARRTIAKYREEIGILPSRLRKERASGCDAPVELPALAGSVGAQRH
jgi:RNA polymerase sigma-54 factor